MSTSSVEAAGAYLDGLDRILAGLGGAGGAFERSLALDPGFALAHLGLSIARQEGGDSPGAAAARARAVDLAASATAREQQQISALAALAARRPGAVDALFSHLRAFPGDVLVLEQLNAYLFFHGGHGKGKRLIDLFDSVAHAYEGDWYHPGKRAFHLQEAGALSEARRLAERSLERNPKNAGAAHALAHCFQAEGDLRAAAELTERWLAVYDPPGRFYGHLWWHVAVAALEEGRAPHAVSVYDDHIARDRTSPKHLALADAVGFLFRLDVRSEGSSAPRWEAVRPLAEELADGPGAVFTDVHAGLLFAAVRDHGRLHRIEEKLKGAAAGDTASPAGVGLSLVEAARAFVGGDHGACVARLAPLCEAGLLEAMGGSNLERALFEGMLVLSRARGG